MRIVGIPGLREIVPGDDLGDLILEATRNAVIRAGDGDVFVVAQKIVSKAEGRIIKLDGIEPSPLARSWAEAYDKDPRIVEAKIRESRRIVRMDRGILIVETGHGYICANAGVDASNVPDGHVTLLPEAPDESAHKLRERLQATLNARLGVIISDTFGRPWREGVVNVALGVAGINPLVDYRGRPDSHGRPMQFTVVAVADELASAAELVMGKTLGVPVAVIQGLDGGSGPGTGKDLIRPAEMDLFR
ncbi:MAG: coenzyme F420-0:L-glutamate ligase [Acidobacteria bacterium]|nr:coenzyme F420-0:L-glutamate ligase [Acidobacteriota bacterium]